MRRREASGRGPGPANRGLSGVETLAVAFERCATEERSALIPFCVACDPDLAATIALARAAAGAGADVLELGVPFSDSLADGPVIQGAYARALAGGATVGGVLECASAILAATELPIVLMTALNPVLSYGLEPFCRRAAAAGVAGLLVADLPLEDAGDLRAACTAVGLATIFLAAPDSGARRIAAAAQASTGFVYVVRRRGVTGARGGGEAADAVAVARRHGSVPVTLGFGITTPEEAAEAARLADGVVVGSAFVRAAAEADGAEAGRGGRAASSAAGGNGPGNAGCGAAQRAETAGRMLAELAAAVRGARRAAVGRAAGTGVTEPETEEHA